MALSGPPGDASGCQYAALPRPAAHAGTEQHVWRRTALTPVPLSSRQFRDGGATSDPGRPIGTEEEEREAAVVQPVTQPQPAQSQQAAFPPVGTVEARPLAGADDVQPQHIQPPQRQVPDQQQPLDMGGRAMPAGRVEKSTQGSGVPGEW